MSNAQIIEVVQAHMDGKKIQIRKMGTHQGFRDGKWYDVVNPRWDFDSCDYRVAPESVEELCPCCGKPRKCEPSKEIDIWLQDNGGGNWQAIGWGIGYHMKSVPK